jgi:putative transposase
MLRAKPWNLGYSSRGTDPLAFFPYLLKGLAIVRPNQVLSTDVTYIRLRVGFVYLAAVIEWFRRYVLA